MADPDKIAAYIFAGYFILVGLGFFFLGLAKAAEEGEFMNWATWPVQAVVVIPLLMLAGLFSICGSLIKRGRSAYTTPRKDEL